MDKERWQQLKKIFNAVVEMPLNERERLLAQVCDGDETLREEVELLLLSDENANSFIEESVVEAAEYSVESAAGLLVGQHLGAYKIEREIGRGGMGAVFLAERADDEYSKKAAVKILRIGLETNQTILRFRRERQILAKFEHPNIAHLLDGGTMPGGLPFLVMEYIEGKPIDVYCDENKLTINQRLGLFLNVCDAVQYAHQHQIVHRDIKPGNILVIADGTPKLLDFGIAKLLDAELSEQNLKKTTAAWRLMTPDYASPEQIRSEEITTATDIYSLGVLLYELLTGHLPYYVKNRFIYEIVRAVCEQEPEKPSASVSRVEEITTGEGFVTTLTPEVVGEARNQRPSELRRRLRGDLDHIILTALRKEPHERYLSAAEFADDIRRYLKGFPISSRKGVLAYRAEKFIKRNKMKIAAAVFGVIVLCAGIAAAVRQTRIAGAESLKASQAEAEKEKQFAILNPDYILVKNSPSLNPPHGITISLWFKAGSSPHEQQLVNKTIISDNSLANDTYGISVSNGGLFWAVVANKDGEPFQDWEIFPRPDILDEQFHHALSTYDAESGMIKVYCDGVLLKGNRSSFVPKKKGGLLADTSTDLLLGATENTIEKNRFLKGVLDEVQIYDRAISAEEVQVLYNSPESQLAGLISWWRGEGNAQDSFGSNHGEFVGEEKYEKGVVGQAFSFGK